MESKRILVCDDDPDIVDVTRLILEMEGYEVESLDYLQNEKEFFRIVTKEQPDLILMDLRIPNIGGVRATEIVKRHSATNDIPVILFSANHTVVEISRRIGADGVVRKPFDIADIIDVVKSLI